VEAFQRTSQGFSVDRVVADPHLNAKFLQECVKLGTPLAPAQLNVCLFRLRKAGKLSHLRARRRTEFAWHELDQYLFGSEIAWKRMTDDQGLTSVDEILCDPLKGAQFDQLAAEFAPGFEPLQYRWGALVLRKLAKDIQSRVADSGGIKPNRGN